MSRVLQEARVHDMKIREAFTAQHHALLFAWIARELGSSGVTASRAALETFAVRFGPSVAGILAGDAGTDFDVLPEGR